jgi:hypothetical protein
MNRRTWLVAGGLGMIGALSRSSRPIAATESVPQVSTASFGRAKHCILLFLTGGPPQHDTWDLKPQATAEIRGELNPIATGVPGIQISELFPQLARQAERYCLVRSVTHGDTVHTSAGYTMLTGAPHPQANASTASLIRTSPNDHPHIGALVARYRSRCSRLPAAVSLPEFIRDANVNDFPGQDAGFLGRTYSPFLVEADLARSRILAPHLVLPADVPAGRVSERDALRRRLNADRVQLDAAALPAELGSDFRRTLDLFSSPDFACAFDIDQEPLATRERYGVHLFGQGCLLARRLVQAGVTLVTVYWHYEGPDDSPVWDTHWNNYPHLRKRLMPPTDQAIAALIEDLSQRGMLSETLLVCLGEFGRSPRINKMAGRDHWPHVQSILLAGGGVRGGQVYGASDQQGAYPADKPVAPPDLIATILHLLGVPPEFQIRDRAGRTLPACHGQPLWEVMG